METWTPGATEDVEWELNGTGYAFAPGNRIRLSLSTAYWPWVWPQPEAAGVWVDPAHSVVELPVRGGGRSGHHGQRAEDPAGGPRIVFEEPEQAPPLGVVYPEPEAGPRPERVLRRDVAAGEWVLEVDPRYGGTRIYPDGLEFTEDALETYRILERDPLSARTRSEWSVRLRRPDRGWDVSIATRSEIGCDEEAFRTVDRVTAKEGGKVVFEREWSKRIPRTAG